MEVWFYTGSLHQVVTEPTGMLLVRVDLQNLTNIVHLRSKVHQAEVIEDEGHLVLLCLGGWDKFSLTISLLVVVVVVAVVVVVVGVVVVVVVVGGVVVVVVVVG